MEENTPSRKDGISKDEEILIRQKTCVFIRELGIQLKLQVRSTIATALIFFQRFYVRHSLKVHDHHMVALTCLFLAAKTEDEPRKLHKVAEKYHTMLQKKQNKTPIQLLNEETYFTYKSKVCIYERIVLQTLSFDLNVVHPHTIMIKMCKQLTKAPAFSSVKPRDFAQHAFNFLNDSGRTTVGVVYSPNTLAASAVYFAFKYFEIQDIAKRKSKKSKGDEEKEEEEQETEYQKEMRENAADIRDVSLQVMQMYLRDPKIQSEKSKHEKIMRIEGEIKIDMRESEKNSTSLKVETKTTSVSSSTKKENGNHMKREAETKIEHTNESPRKQRRVE